MKQGQMMDLGLPAGLEMFQEIDGIEIRRRWFSLSTIFLTVFVIFWCGFLVFWYSMALQTRALAMLLFPLIHVAVGVGLAYYVLAGYLNKTYIRVNHSAISICHAPLPSFGNKTIDANDIKQIYVKQHVSHSRRGGTSVTFEVHALTHSQKNLKLLSGLSSDEQALFIEQEIEKFLRIENVPVRGEMGQPGVW